MQGPQISIRRARQEDAPAIIQVHYDAVHVTARKDYEQGILEDWSSKDAERAERMKRQIEDNPESTIMIVAEINGVIVGFGEIVPAAEELRAVYVSPSVNRMGVGRSILQELEALARQENVVNLSLDASLTAESFYTVNGYVVDERSEHILNSGRRMTCVKMHKTLR